MWSDNETKIDFLNFEDTVESVTDILHRNDLHPLSLGLFGGWGTGKSSLLQMVMEEMQKEQNSVVLYFDAWRFQGYDDARAALLETIGNKLFKLAAEESGFKEKALSLLGRIDKLRTLGLMSEGVAIAMGLPAFGTIVRGLEGARDAVQQQADDEDIQDIKDGLKDISKKTKGLLKPKEISTPPQEIEAFRSELKELLTDMDKTLYVFIDNLDRCLPKNAIQTLEAVRLFLFMDRTAFVVAADEEMIRVAVRDHYKAGSTRLVTDYLDKLVQYPVRVPSVGVNELKCMLIMLMITKSDMPVGSEKANSIRNFLISKLQQSWKEAFPTVDEILAQSSSHELTNEDKLAVRAAYQLARIAAPTLARAATVQGNPRIVKRLLNIVSQRQSIAAKRGINLSEGALLKLVIFERCAGAAATLELFRLVAETNNGKVSILAEWEENESPPVSCPSSWQEHEEFISAWCALEPKLGDKDLRAAVYLARDLQPTGTGSSALSELAREALSTLNSAENRNRSSTKDAVTMIPAPEKPLVMNELIDRLDGIEDWARRFKKPWTGAVALANDDQNCAKALKAFMSRKFPDGLPKWTEPVMKSLEEIEF